MKKKFRLRLFVGEEYQPLRVVPFWLWAMLFVALAGQVAFANLILPPPQARAEALRPPPSDAVLRLFAFGDTPMLARVVMLNLQGYDNQRGAVPAVCTLSRCPLGQSGFSKTICICRHGAVFGSWIIVVASRWTCRAIAVASFSSFKV